MKFLVTGATGSFGARVVETLLKTVSANEIAVSVRNPEKTDNLRSLGVDVRQADFNDPDSLEKAFQGVERLLIVSTNEPITEKRISQHVNAIEAAKRAKVQLVVYTSAVNIMPLNAAHKATEKVIVESGIPYSILRNNFYLETEIDTIKACMMGAPIVTSAGSGKIGLALRNDYADAAAAVLVGEGHESTIYELSGKPINYDELAAEIGKVIGKEVLVQHVDDAGYAAFLKQVGIPEMFIPILASAKAGIREGFAEVESNDLETLLKRPVTPINEALNMLVSSLSK